MLEKPEGAQMPHELRKTARVVPEISPLLNAAAADIEGLRSKLAQIDVLMSDTWMRDHGAVVLHVSDPAEVATVKLIVERAKLIRAILRDGDLTKKDE